MNTAPGQQTANHEHLIWDLEAFRNHTRAANFIQGFQEQLCVYSRAVGQLYTNYEVTLPRNRDKSLIILPNPYAFHDTFSHIDPEAVVPTRFIITPGSLTGESRLHIRIPFNKGRRARLVPLAAGLRALTNAFRKDEDGFLPVITKGDLRALRHDLPVLYLHRLLPSRLTQASTLDKRGMAGAIDERLNRIQ